MAIMSYLLALFQRICSFLSAVGGLEQLNITSPLALRWWSACHMDLKEIQFFITSLLSSLCQAVNMKWKYNFIPSVRGKLTMKC